MTYKAFERGGPKFSNTTARALAYHTGFASQAVVMKSAVASKG